MPVPLDSRQLRILRFLLAQREPVSTASIAESLGLNQRAVRYKLPGIQFHLRSESGLSLEQRRGVGISIAGSDQDRERMGDSLRDPEGIPQRVLAAAEREQVVKAILLSRAPEPVTVEDLQSALDVSRTTCRRDLLTAEPWLEAHGLSLSRRPGRGVVLVGSESAVRRATVKLILESVPAVTLAEAAELGVGGSPMMRTTISSGLLDFLLTLPIKECTELVSRKALALGAEASETVFALYLAVAIQRLAAGNEIEMDAGQLRSLLEHPLAGASSGLAVGLKEYLGADLPRTEVAGLTSMMLGFGSHESERALGSTGYDIEPMALAAVALAAEYLHPILADDQELIRSLLNHFRRLAVRLDYGVPVYNPLLREVAERYPKVHGVAFLVAEQIADRLGRALPEDEVGFITMYLSGAMERTHLWPRRRAIVLCPAGMATVWILVSRVQAEFPHVEVSSVYSVGDFDPSVRTSDLIISTVDLPASENEVVVVSPLLSAEDIHAIRSRLLSSE